MIRHKPGTLSAEALAAILGCGLSRYEIANRTGVSEAVLSRFVNGRSELSVRNLEKIAPVIGLRIVIKRLPSVKRS